MQAALETFEGGVAVERGADAAVIVDSEFQSQTERVGLAAHDAIGMGLGPDGFEPGLAGGGWRCHMRIAVAMFDAREQGGCHAAKWLQTL